MQQSECQRDSGERLSSNATEKRETGGESSRKDVTRCAKRAFNARSRSIYTYIILDEGRWPSFRAPPVEFFVSIALPRGASIRLKPWLDVRRDDARAHGRRGRMIKLPSAPKSPHLLEGNRKSKLGSLDAEP